jgi:hypothetical protein
MRRSLTVFALALVAVAALASAALAKEGGVELSSTPFGTPPGGSWTPTLTLIDINGRLPNAKPMLRLANLGTGEQTDFAARPTGTPGQYDLSVVFPTEGRYSYTVTDGVTDREYTYPPVRIVGSETVVPRPPTASGGDAFPIWAPITGGIALLLAALGGGVWFQRRRVGLSH